MNTSNTTRHICCAVTHAHRSRLAAAMHFLSQWAHLTQKALGTRIAPAPPPAQRSFLLVLTALNVTPEHRVPFFTCFVWRRQKVASGTSGPVPVSCWCRSLWTQVYFLTVCIYHDIMKYPNPNFFIPFFLLFDAFVFPTKEHFHRTSLNFQTLSTFFSFLCLSFF